MFGAHQILFKGYYMKRLIVALALLAPAIAIAQTRQGSLTCTTPTITTATSFTVAAADAQRHYLLIQNNHNANILCSLTGATLTGIAPTSTNKGIVLVPGASYEANGSLIPVDVIKCYQASGGDINTVVVCTG